MNLHILSASINEVIESVSTREWAAFLWGIFFVAYIFRDKRICLSFVNVVKALLQKALVKVITVAAFYVTCEVFVLRMMGLWSVSNFKTTMTWCLTFAFVSVFEVVAVGDRKKTIRDVAGGVLSVAVVIAFVTGLQSFSFVVEFFMFPVVALSAYMAGAAKVSSQFRIVERPLHFFLSIVGLFCFLYSAYRTCVGLEGAGVWANTLEFSIPIALSVGFIPFLWGWKVFAVYSETFAIVSRFISDRRLILYARWLALKYIKDDLDMLVRWRMEIVSCRPTTKTELVNTFESLRALRKREASPPFVSEEGGWSPYRAMQFMADAGYDTGYYRNLSGDEWGACSKMVDVGDGVILNSNIAYYVEGGEFAANTLKLVLNVYDIATADVADKLFVSKCEHLLKRAVGPDAVQRIMMLLVTLEEFSDSIPFGTVSLSRSDFIGGMTGGYTRKFIVCRGRPEIQSPC